MRTTPLSDEQLFRSAPSIFSDTPIEGVSDRYAFVPTHSVLDTFRDAGYYPIMASESKVRNTLNEGYQKHIIQFRGMDDLLRPDSKDEYADIVLTNSHNRTSSFIVDLAFFRIVCANMLVVPSTSFSHHSIIHSGFNKFKVERAISEVTSFIPNIQTQIDRFKSIVLSRLEQKSFANAGVDIRFDRKLYEVDPDEFLKVQRDEDDDPTLWSAYNRIQESMIRGGVKGRNKESGKQFTSKSINSIDANLKLNKELFSTAQMIADIKSQPVAMAA